jgi:hypothetical protein
LLKLVADRQCIETMTDIRRSDYAQGRAGRMNESYWACYYCSNPMGGTIVLADFGNDMIVDLDFWYQARRTIFARGIVVVACGPVTSLVVAAT